MNSKPDFQARDIVAQENAGRQTLVFAVNATPGATRRVSQLVEFAENSSGLEFQLRETSCFIQRSHNIAVWENWTAAEMTAAHPTELRTHAAARRRKLTCGD